MSSSDLPVTLDDIQQAASRIRTHVHRTPIQTSRTVDARTGARVLFKCEHLQRAGAFKFRGACNAVLSLSEEQAHRGVATHSSGNHAQALALAARLRGISATIVMPGNALRVKVNAVREYGGQVVFCGNTQGDREQALGEFVARTAAIEVHPSDDPRVIAGQGTCCLEALDEQPAVDVVLAPVGGGGLLSGTAIAASGLPRPPAVLGVEPEAADDARRSFRTGALAAAGEPRTIADGLRTSLGQNTFRIVRACVADIVTVSEGGIVAAMRFAWERMKALVEPSAAVPLAALLEGVIPVRGKTVLVILSGGNVDLDALPWAARP